MIVLVGTDKGLIEFRIGKEKSTLSKIHFLGLPIGVIHHHERNGGLWVAINHKHWGPKIHGSTDSGNSWQELGSPKFTVENGSVIKNVWAFICEENENPERYYVGVEPAALFITNDSGKSYELVKGLWDHNSRPKWEGGGKGSLDPFLHTIVIDPEDHNHIYVGISCAGVFETRNRGLLWEPINEGLVADYLPDPFAKIGHDPHCLIMSKQDRQVIWQQNHCGIFRTTDGGQHWKNVSDSSGKATYGFAMVVDEKDDRRAWVAPSQSDSLRVPFENAIRIYTTDDAGETWRELNKGLPQEGAFDIVLRHAMDISGSHIVFGTNNGNLYHSSNHGESWNIISQNLASIRALKIIPH